MGDLISRKWLMEAVEEGWIKFDTQEDYNRIIHLVRDIAPSTQSEQKVGKWESQKGVGYKCSECGQYALDRIEGNYVYVAATTPYCPFCGKRME